MVGLATKMRGMLKRRTPGSGWVRRLFGSLIAIGLLAPVTASADEIAPLKPAYRLGVFPYLPALTIDRLYGPLADFLSIELDRLVKLRTKSTFENFADAIRNESYDIVFVHPFFYVDAVDRHGYLPLARLDQELRAVLVATEGSGVMDLQNLAGKTIGLPPKLAAVSKLIKSALIDNGMRPGLDVGIRHFRNKASCLQATVAGGVAACGVPAFVLEEIGDFKSKPLHVIFEAPPVSHFAFAVHHRVSEHERKRLQDLILSLGNGNVEGFGPQKRFIRIDQQDYAGIRAKTNNLKTLAQR